MTIGRRQLLLLLSTVVVVAALAGCLVGAALVGAVAARGVRIGAGPTATPRFARFTGDQVLAEFQRHGLPVMDPNDPNYQSIAANCGSYQTGGSVVRVVSWGGTGIICLYVADQPSALAAQSARLSGINGFFTARDFVQDNVILGAFYVDRSGGAQVPQSWNQYIAVLAAMH